MSAKDAFASAFACAADEVIAVNGVDTSAGLTAAHVASLRERCGWNELSAAPEEPWWKKFLDQF